MVDRQLLGAGVTWIAPEWAVKAYQSEPLSWSIQFSRLWTRAAEKHGFNTGSESFNTIYIWALVGEKWAQKLIDKATPKIVAWRMMK